MNKFVIDSSAWIEYLKGSDSGNKLNSYFKESEIFTTSLCVAEIIAKVLREGFSADIALKAILSISLVTNVDLEVGDKGGRVYYELRKNKPKIALSDAITLASARKLGAKIITFDHDFEGLKEAIILEK